MEQNQQQKKFVCKFCNKRYPCGKSLGGHIRTHMNDDNNNNNNNSAEAEDEIELINISKIHLTTNKVAAASGVVLGGGGQSGYGLRENPKKTRRFADSRGVVSKQEMLLCKECGKGFQSLKALCGHMACHSDKEKVTKNSVVEDLSASSEKQQKLVMDSQSDTETSAPSRRRRSKRMKYKTIGAYNSSSFNGNSSSVSEIEQDQEEVAMCLIMLSRDSGYKKGWNSVADSSDNNSVVLETKSSSTDMRITAKHGVNHVSNGNEFVEMKKPGGDKKLKSAEIDVSENSDSGYFNNGPKKVDSEVSVDGYHKNYEFKKPKPEFGSGFEEFDDAELGKKLNRFKVKKGGGGAAAAAKSQAYNTEFFSNNADKRKEYECLTCNKVFHSHRSLWGHQASHSKINGCYESTYGSGENSVENQNDSIPVTNSSHSKNPVERQDLSVNAQKRLGSKKSKGHQCPICFRMFKSGQALGGHKRSHFIGGAENGTVVINQELSKMPALIDLNLPAPIEEDAIAHGGFVPW